MWVNHLISNAGWVWRPHAWHITPDTAILVTDDPSHINIRNLSSTPSPDWGLLITHSSHYLKSRVSIIKLDPDDAGLTRTKIEEGELGEAEVWRRGTRWHQDKERWMMVVATGDKHWQEGLRPGERVSYSPRSALKQTPHPIPLFLNIDHSHACNFSLQLLYCWLGQANFLCNFSLSALEAPELSGSDLWM